MTDDEKVQLAVLRSEHSALKARVEKMEGNQRWVVLAVIGAVIASLMQQLGISK